ncbi:MAG: hypothetical protein ACOCRK_09915 [bacterium]
MDCIEVGINFWYVHDNDGIIYSLRVKPYILKGTEEEKISFLRERAQLDYLIAEPFSIPERFHITFDSEKRKMPVGHLMMLSSLESPIKIFEDALEQIEDRFPAQSEVDIPQELLFTLTPLSLNSSGIIEPTSSKN